MAVVVNSNNVRVVSFGFFDYAKTSCTGENKSCDCLIVKGLLVLGLLGLLAFIIKMILNYKVKIAELESRSQAQNASSNNNSGKMSDDNPSAARNHLKFCKNKGLDAGALWRQREEEDIQLHKQKLDEQAVWALGNTAGDSPLCRDYVLNEGILLPLLQSMSIEKCQRSTIVLGAVELPVDLVRCEQTTVVAVCRRFATIGSKFCAIHVLTPNRLLVFGGSESLVFGPYHTHYSKLEKRMVEVGMGVQPNHWDKPLYMDMHSQVAVDQSLDESSLWEIPNPSACYTFVIPFEMEGDTKVREHMNGRKLDVFMMVIGKMTCGMGLGHTVFPNQMKPTRSSMQEAGRTTRSMAMEQISMRMGHTTRVSGTAGKEMAGDGCTIRTVPSTRENGMTDNEVDRECLSLPVKTGMKGLGRRTRRMDLEDSSTWRKVRFTGASGPMTLPDVEK